MAEAEHAMQATRASCVTSQSASSYAALDRLIDLQWAEPCWARMLAGLINTARRNKQMQLAAGI